MDLIVNRSSSVVEVFMVGLKILVYFGWERHRKLLEKGLVLESSRNLSSHDVNLVVSVRNPFTEGFVGHFDGIPVIVEQI